MPQIPPLLLDSLINISLFVSRNSLLKCNKTTGQVKYEAIIKHKHLSRRLFLHKISCHERNRKQSLRPWSAGMIKVEWRGRGSTAKSYARRWPANKGVAGGGRTPEDQKGPRVLAAACWRMHGRKRFMLPPSQNRENEVLCPMLADPGDFNNWTLRTRAVGGKFQP